MKVDIKSNIKSTTEEIVDIHIEFNPMNHDEEGLVALVTTLIDLIGKYDRLNKLS